MRKGLLGVIVGVGMMIAQSAGAADMVRYDKSASNVQPEQTVAQIQMNPDCNGPHCRPCATPCPRPCANPCARQCPPRHHHRHHHHKKHHHNHKHGAKKHHANKAQQSGHNESIEEKKMSSDRNHPSARKTSAKAKNSNNAYVEEYIDDVGREHR
ncbi:hypothetical protein [Candidatus Berkiella aquae]|uniref:Uncharacterized protein n=1 Tax=Candidatus Berkiella aquae TaxID=295108 RepID=A0A0Q9YNR2_9GAMM|nr:hypothetical protein [Candidatus Berkiella aquae]MCS5712387.1 hypothetical protein [Candidatus Berkiella aquae]